MLRFLMEERPEGSQIILGVEDPVGLTEEDAKVLRVGVRRNQLLREDEYGSVADHLRPYIAQLVD
jgi:hypothetical protein